ncbi:MAG: hypothetical protein Q8Q03_02205 [bacterium]|nr:hypothetical protein [bacterium]
MNDEIINVLKEMRDLQKEAIKNQQEAVALVKMTQKSITKKLLIFLAVVVLAILFMNFIR